MLDFFLFGHRKSYLKGLSLLLIQIHVPLKYSDWTMSELNVLKALNEANTVETAFAKLCSVDTRTQLH